MTGMVRRYGTAGGQRRLRRRRVAPPVIMSVQAFIMVVCSRLADRLTSFVALPRAVLATRFAALRYALMNGFLAISVSCFRVGVCCQPRHHRRDLGASVPTRRGPDADLAVPQVTSPRGAPFGPAHSAPRGIAPHRWQRS